MAVDTCIYLLLLHIQQFVFVFQLEDFISKNKLGRARSTFRQAVEATKTNIIFLKSNLQDLTEWLANQ